MDGDPITLLEAKRGLLLFVFLIFFLAISIFFFGTCISRPVGTTLSLSLSFSPSAVQYSNGPETLSVCLFVCTGTRGEKSEKNVWTDKGEELTRKREASRRCEMEVRLS